MPEENEGFGEDPAGPFIPEDAFPLFLAVPFSRKDDAKVQGARWHSKLRRWYAEGMHSFLRSSALLEWVRDKDKYWLLPALAQRQRERWHELGAVPLEVPFEDGALAKLRGARWNWEHNCWTIELFTLLQSDAFDAWIPFVLKADIEAEAQAECEREAVAKWYRDSEARCSDPELLLSLFGLVPSAIYKTTGFCGGCDSHIRDEWVVYGQCLHHVSSQPSSDADAFKAQGIPLPERPMFCEFFNLAERGLIKAWLEENGSRRGEKEHLSIGSRRKKATVSQLAQLYRCEQQLLFDRMHGEKRSATWLAAQRAGTREHARYEQAVEKGRAPHGSRCFIATACFEEDVIALKRLRRFRDAYLRPHASGRRFILIYYRLSRPVAGWLMNYPVIRAMIRPVLAGIARIIARFFRVD